MEAAWQQVCSERAQRDASQIQGLLTESFPFAGAALGTRGSGASPESPALALGLGAGGGTGQIF